MKRVDEVIFKTCQSRQEKTTCREQWELLKENYETYYCLSTVFLSMVIFCSVIYRLICYLDLQFSRLFPYCILQKSQ